MDVAGILRHKGDDVATIDPGASLAEAVEALATRRIGALVVSSDGHSVEGILSERDIIRRLYDAGDDAAATPVRDACTTEVRTCAPSDDVEELMRRMTEGRFRHLPVVADGRLVGIVSIGDIVKHRVDELESLARDLTNYVSGTW